MTESKNPFKPITLTSIPNDIVDDIDRELADARHKFENMNSYHEAYGILKEELDEFWDCVRLWKGNDVFLYEEKCRKELIQIAAMAVRTIMDMEI